MSSADTASRPVWTTARDQLASSDYWAQRYSTYIQTHHLQRASSIDVMWAQRQLHDRLIELFGTESAPLNTPDVAVRKRRLLVVLSTIDAACHPLEAALCCAGLAHVCQ